MKDLQHYVALDWTIQDSERNDDGRYFVRRIAELPGFVVAARTKEQLEQEYEPALRAFLQSYLADGEEPPLPETGSAVATWSESGWSFGNLGASQSSVRTVGTATV